MSVCARPGIDRASRRATEASREAPGRSHARMRARAAHASASSATLRAVHYALTFRRRTNLLRTYSNQQRTRCYQRALACRATHHNKWLVIGQES